MEFLVVLLVLVAVVLVVTAPLRRGSRSGGPAADLPAARELAELEAARDAKLREIRDAELDHRTGKLSEDDFARVDAELRAEAAEILRALDATRQPLT